MSPESPAGCLFAAMVMYFEALMGLLFWGVTSVSAANVSAVDDTGQTVQLSRPARRVISLAPHITELLFAAGAGDQIVGAAEFSDYPAGALHIPRIGDATRVDRERIALLQPDLVVAWGSGNPAAELQALRKLGIPVFVSEPRRLEDIPRQLESLGRLTGHVETSQLAAQLFRSRLATLRDANSSAERLEVFFQVASHPLITLNGRHLINAVIELCGGRNIFGESAGLAPNVSIEAVVAAAPEVILYSEYPGHGSAELKSQWGDWRTIPAVYRQQLFGIPADVINRAGPRVLEGGTSICVAFDAVRRNRTAHQPGP